MFVLKQDSLIKVLKTKKGISLVSYGKPRDAFPLPVDVPSWTSGYRGKYEMKHTHVPAGVMVAVGNLEDVDISDQDKLKAQLKEIDIYPMGSSGNFAGKDMAELHKWFTDRSRLDNDVNNQTPIAHAARLTPSGLGAERYGDLKDYLANNMQIFKDPDANGALTPSDRQQRLCLTEGLLKGLSQTVRYTRLDDPAVAFQLTEQIAVEKDPERSMRFGLKEPAKIMLLRNYRNG